MNITALVELKVDPKLRDDFIAFMRNIIGASRDFPGCLGVIVRANKENPGGFVISSRWESLRHLNQYTAWRHEVGTNTEIMAYLTSPPVLNVYDDLDI